MACLVFRNRSSLRLGVGSLPFRNVLLEHPGVGANELFDRLRRLPADALDDIGLGTEDAVLVILCDGDEMRRQVVGKPRVFHKSLAPGLDGDVHILDRLPPRTARGLGDLRETHVAGTCQDVPVAEVWFGVGKDADDGPETIDALRQHTETVKRDGWAEARIHRGIGNTPAAGKFSSGSRNERTTSVAPAVRRSE